MAATSPTDGFEPKRASDFEPAPRLFTVKQMGGILAFIAVLQTIGGKFVIDSYIDSRVAVHDRNAHAHTGVLAEKVSSDRDGDSVKGQLDQLARQLNETNQRLARIEGALSVQRGK